MPDSFAHKIYYEELKAQKAFVFVENVEKSKIIPHTFKIDWAENKTQGLTGNIGGMFRADREEMYLAGQLKQ